MNYIDEGSTLPVPFNMIPTPKSFKYAYKTLKNLCCTDADADPEYENTKRETFIKVRVAIMLTLCTHVTPECVVKLTVVYSCSSHLFG